MFVTHGMGGYSDMRYDQLQQCYIDVMKEDFGGDGGEETEIYPIEWYTTLHGLESVDKRMAPCTLPTCGVLRRVNNEILADVLYCKEIHDLLSSPPLTPEFPSLQTLLNSMVKPWSILSQKS